MLFFDSHVHSHHARDSAQTLEEIYCAALKKSLAGVSVTDPADIWYLEKDHTFEHISSALEAVDLLKQIGFAAIPTIEIESPFLSRLMLKSGIMIGEMYRWRYPESP